MHCGVASFRVGSMAHRLITGDVKADEYSQHVQKKKRNGDRFWGFPFIPSPGRGGGRGGGGGWIFKESIGAAATVAGCCGWPVRMH